MFRRSRRIVIIVPADGANCAVLKDVVQGCCSSQVGVVPADGTRRAHAGPRRRRIGARRTRQALRRRCVGFRCRGIVRQVRTDRARRAIRELVVENLRSCGVGIVLSRGTNSAGSSRRRVSAGGAEDARPAQRVVSCRASSAQVCGVAGRSSRTSNSADARTVGGRVMQNSRRRRVAQILPRKA